MKKRSNKQELAALKAASIKKEKHDATMAVLYILSGLLCTVLVVTGGVLGFRAIRKSYLDSGRKYRNTLVYQTDHFEVNMAMFSYRFYSDLYSGRLDALGLDSPEELKDQTFEEGEFKNYYEYAAWLSANSIRNDLSFAESAAVKGLSLSEAELGYIQARLDRLVKNAQARNMDTEVYLSENYGRGVRLTDIEDLLKIEFLAEKERTTVSMGLSATEEEINRRLENNGAGKYYRIDYYMVVIPYGIEDKDSEEKKEQKRLQVKEQAQALASCKDLDSYLALSEEIFRELYKDQDNVDEYVEYALKEAHFVGEKMDFEEIYENRIDRYLADLDLKAGDTTVVEDSKNATAIFVEKAPYSIDQKNDAYLVLDLYLEYFSADSEADRMLENILEEYESEPTEEHFRELVRKYSQAEAEAAKDGYTDDTYISDADYEDAPKSFNGLLRTAKENNAFKNNVATLYGANGRYLVYALGEGQTLSYVEARQAVLEEKYSATVTDYPSLYKVTPKEEQEICSPAPLYTAED